MKYGNAPIEIASDVFIDNSEMYFYQYLPIKLRGSLEMKIPDQLLKFQDLIKTCNADFFGYGHGIKDYYIYITAKCLYAPTGSNLNRPGWHSDGFLTNDINYIWSDSLPTEYITGSFNNISQNHKDSLKEFDFLGCSIPSNFCKENSIYRLDDKVIHRSQINNGDPFLRQFIKISFSKEKYNLKGNSHNYLIDYDWEMKDRESNRNHPSK